MKQNIVIEDAGEKLLTVSEVAKYLRCDSTTVRRWINQGTLDAVELPHVHHRRSFRIKESTLHHLLAPAK